MTDGFLAIRRRATKGGSLPTRKRANERDLMIPNGAENSSRFSISAGNSVSAFLKEVVGDALRMERGSLHRNNGGANFDGHGSRPQRDPEDLNLPPEIGQRIPRWKRVLDLSLIFLTLPLWLPIVAVIAIWIGVTSPGPIFYRQTRIGFRARRFMIVKFRTMKVNAETQSHEAYLERLMVSDTPMVKLDSRGDPRLISGGRILRAAGLDELPQLFNVIAGEMSLVGPRPCTAREFEHYEASCRARVAAAPGLTGYWQVNGKNQTTFRRMIELDMYYARNLSLGLDLKILLKTIPALWRQVTEMLPSSQRSLSPEAAPTAHAK